MEKPRFKRRLFLYSIKGITLIFLWISIAQANAGPSATTHFEDAWHMEFELLKEQIRFLNPDYVAYEKLKREALHKEALILKSDKTPVDVILRRTGALLRHLMQKGVELHSEEVAFNALLSTHKASLNKHEQFEKFKQVAELRRKIAFKNPLLDFDQIIFLKHNKMARGERHMIDQYLGFNNEKAGGVCILDNPFSDYATAKSVLSGKKVSNGRLKGQVIEDQGSFISLDLSYDGKTILYAFTEAEHEIPKKADWSRQITWEFAEKELYDRTMWYHWRPESTFDIFKTDLESGITEQLTDSDFNNYDPVFLPGGRIAFISDRVEMNCRCGNRWAPSAVLHSMEVDGSDVIQLSYHETNEWHPSVNNDGMLAYTRWDYVDRDSDIAHHLWTCFPDGRDPRSAHGNYPEKRESRPWIELGIRAIPNSQKYMAVAAPHHGENYGSIIQIDTRIPDDRAMSQIKRLTPDIWFPEAEMRPGIPHLKGKHNPQAEVMGQPWPLDEHFYLAVYADHDLFYQYQKDLNINKKKRHHIQLQEGDKKYGLYLADAFGNRIFLYRDSTISCLDPIPLQPRKSPPIIPSQTLQTEADRNGEPEPAYGTVAVMNAYLSDMNWPEDTKIKQLRIINLFGKSNANADQPPIGLADQALARGVIGTVPVEEDGSAHFRLPAGMSFYMQALDEEGKMVQNMRSATYVHPGERLSCIGCHESKQSTPDPSGAYPTALRRAPSEPERGPTGSYPIQFPLLVQPVLDSKCVDCHVKEKAPGLSGTIFDKTTGRSQAFETLKDYAWGMDGGNGSIVKNGRSYSIPGQDGARVSKLYKILKDGHYELELTPEEWERIFTWIDCNSNYYGAYHDAEAQTKGVVVKPLRGLPSGVSFEELKR
jgi:hypothetical protein